MTIAENGDAGATALPWALRTSASAAQACDATCAHLARAGLLSSVFLRQGNRLRCRGVRGYLQVFDGMPGSSIIGRTAVSGERLLLRDVTSSPHYLAAAPDVVDELCVPLRVAGAVVGVLNVETTGRLTAVQEQLTDAAAAALSGRLAELSLPAESPSQKLGRYAAALATLAATSDRTAVLGEVVRAAVDVSGLESAVLCLRQDDGALAVEAAAGPHAAALAASSSEELGQIASWVRSGSSCYSTSAPGPASSALPGHRFLRELGAAAFAVLPLRMGHEPRGLLLLLTAQRLQLGTDEVELLELLAGTVVTCLEIADKVQALRDRADADALTGLGHHAAFHATLPPARRATVGARLAVLYIDVDHFKAVNDSRGHAAGDQLLVQMADSMRSALRDEDRLFRIGGDEFAALARVDTPAQAVALAERLRAQVHESTGGTLSVGVAVEEPDESDADLLARADAAVYGAKAAGRATVHLAPAPLPAAPGAVRGHG